MEVDGGHGGAVGMSGAGAQHFWHRRGDGRKNGEEGVGELGREALAILARGGVECGCGHEGVAVFLGAEEQPEWEFEGDFVGGEDLSGDRSGSAGDRARVHVRECAWDFATNSRISRLSAWATPRP